MSAEPAATDLTWLICRFAGGSPIIVPGSRGEPVLHNAAQVEIGVAPDRADSLFRGEMQPFMVAAHTVVESRGGIMLAPIAINWANVAFVTPMAPDAAATLVARLRNADAARKPKTGPILYQGGAA